MMANLSKSMKAEKSEKWNCESLYEIRQEMNKLRFLKVANKDVEDKEEIESGEKWRIRR